MTDSGRPRVYAEFPHFDARGRLRLDRVGTLEDLQRQRIRLEDGLTLLLYADDSDELGRSDELWVEGAVRSCQEGRYWAAAIDRDAIRHASNEARAESPT